MSNVFSTVELTGDTVSEFCYFAQWSQGVELRTTENRSRCGEFEPWSSRFKTKYPEPLCHAAFNLSWKNKTLFERESVIFLNRPSPMPLFRSTPHENHMALDKFRAVSSFSFRASLNRPNGLNRSNRYSITATMWTDSKTSSHRLIWKGRRNESRLFLLDSLKKKQMWYKSYKFATFLVTH